MTLPQSVIGICTVIIGAAAAITIGLAAPIATAEPPSPEDPCIWLTGTPPPSPSVCPILHVPGFPIPLINGIFPQPGKEPIVMGSR